MSAPKYTRRDFIQRLALAAAALVAPRGLSAADSPPTKPNIIVAMIDNVGYGDFGINGNDIVRTPHLDRFADEGIQFSRFYCNPMCSPTRASLMTGRCFYRTGVIHTSRGGALMHGDEVTIAEYLRQAGYATGMFGKWHLGDNYPMRPQDQGFDQTLWHKSGRIGQVPDAPNTYVDPMLWRHDRKVRTKGYCTDVFFDEALRFIEANRDRPFFVYLPTNVGHTARESVVGPLAPHRYKDPYRTAGLSNSIANVYAMVTNFDENFGRLLARLEALGLRENTFVMFTSDDGPGHGYNAGLRNGSIYEARIRVPLFVQWQGRLPARRTCDRVASHIDILPTLLDLSGVRAPEEPVIDGTSLLPLLEGSETAWADRPLLLQCHRGLQPKRYQNCAVNQVTAAGRPS
jgi:arylsulfatase A-like enzyme